MNEIHLPIQMQKIIRSALKAEVLHERSTTQERTSQRGIISPLILRYMVLRTYGINQLNTSANLVGYSNQKIRYSAKCNDRSAYDIVFFLEEGENENQLRNKVDQFLFERELKVKEAKTHLVNSKEGFDFLE